MKIFQILTQIEANFNTLAFKESEMPIILLFVSGKKLGPVILEHGMYFKRCALKTT
jgi:hypothetical protein